MNSDKPLGQAQASSLPSPDLLLSLATAPFLVGLLTSSVIGAAMQEIGRLSEEVFRGDRLPLLNFPATSDPGPDQIESH